VSPIEIPAGADDLVFLASQLVSSIPVRHPAFAFARGTLGRLRGSALSRAHERLGTGAEWKVASHPASPGERFSVPVCPLD